VLLSHMLCNALVAGGRLLGAEHVRTNMPQNRPLHLNLSANCIRLLKMCLILDKA